MKRSKVFSVAVIRFVRSAGSDFVGRHLAQQLLRSATSIGANLHEADMADTVKDFCNKVNIAQKEASETVYWLELLREANVLPASQLVDVQAEATEIRKILREIVRASRKSAAK